MDTIKKGVAKVLNRIGYKMFIDLEFSMPPYTSIGAFDSEIVEYGFVIEDDNGMIITEETSLVNPTNELGITDRTLDFLSLKKEDFNLILKNTF